MGHPKMQVIGGEEWCSFKTLNIPAIKARIDSGAKTSSIQAANIKRFKKGRAEWVSFEINPIKDNLSISIQCQSPILSTRTIKSSTGVSEKRYVIIAPITIGDSTYDIELTLANRDGMDFRMLLGREAMNKRFLVDPSERYLMGEILEDKIESMYSYLVHDKSGLKIGLLASDKNLYSNKRLMEAGLARGHEMQFYNIYSFEIVFQ